jgi:hypothetical protein
MSTTRTKFKLKSLDDYPYRVDAKLKFKIEVLAKQLEKNDVWIIIDGDEGSGKTNTAAYILHLFSWITGRKFEQERFYFDSDDMFQWVKENPSGLINWDEAALGGLSAEWWSNAQRNLLKFAMTGRKKHHVFVLCIPKFYKLNEYLRIDRSHALIHMDTGKRKDRYGNAMWLTRKGKGILNRIWKTKKYLAYNESMKKGVGFYFNVPYVIPDIMDEEKYEKMKDDAISNIGEKKNIKKQSAIEIELKEIKNKIRNLPVKEIDSKAALARHMGWRRQAMYIEA